MAKDTTLSLLQHRMKQQNISGAVSQQAAILCAIIDEYNDMHWYDRDRYHARISRLEKKLTEDEA